MKKDGKIKTVVDVNIFVSFLIGKKLRNFKNALVSSSVDLLYNNLLLSEIKTVAQRPKLAKYFHPDDVNDIILLVEAIGTNVIVKKEPTICRDMKDNYLLGIAEYGNADYLVTSDKDLLVLKKHKGTKIITARQFEKIIS